MVTPMVTPTVTLSTTPMVDNAVEVPLPPARGQGMPRQGMPYALPLVWCHSTGGHDERFGPGPPDVWLVTVSPAHVACLRGSNSTPGWNSCK